MSATLTTDPVSARAPERRAEELLNELLKSYFTGTPHQSPLGDVTFPVCALHFNQTEIGDPESGKPQIHAVFGEVVAQETWFCAGDLSPWEETLAEPASGVAYGRTAEGTIEESVHGKLVRTLAGTDIRWQASGPDFVEQVFAGTWQTVRTFSGATALRWTRSGSDYLEQVNTGTWTTARTVATVSSVWDGTRTLVTAPLRVSFWVRAVNSGGAGNRTDHLCRTVSANLHELLGREDVRTALGKKGLRNFRVKSGPTPMQSTGYQTRLILATCALRYFQPRQL